MKKQNKRSLFLNLSGVLLLVLAVVLFAAYRIYYDPAFLVHYEQMLKKLSDFEYAVATLPYKWQILLSILAIFLLKSIVPLPIPISAVCLIAGMALPMWMTLLVNTLGFVILVTVKYYWGMYLGGSWLHKFLNRYTELQRVLNGNRHTTAALLFVCRMVPSFPVSTVSKLYGTMQYSYWRFLLYSVLGYLPKLISYSFIGRNVYNPFSKAFIAPIILTLTLSGLALLAVNAMIQFYNKAFKNKTETQNRKEEKNA